MLVQRLLFSLYFIFSGGRWFGGLSGSAGQDDRCGSVMVRKTSVGTTTHIFDGHGDYDIHIL